MTTKNLALVSVTIATASMIGCVGESYSAKIDQVRAAYEGMSAAVESLDDNVKSAEALAAEAIATARESGDAAAIDSANRAAELAAQARSEYSDRADSFAKLGDKVETAIAAMESGEFDQETGATIGGALGSILGPQGGVIGTLVLGGLGMLWQRLSGRSKLRELAKAINTAKKADDTFARAIDAAGPVIRESMSPSTLLLVDKLRR